eukprot:scaffold44436_cov18-Tisochrysis_lutea.AAC.1
MLSTWHGGMQACHWRQEGARECTAKVAYQWCTSGNSEGYTPKGWLTHEARVVREPNLKARRHNSLHMHQSQGSIQENHHANQGAWTHECVLCARGWGDLRLPDECVLCVPEECVQCTTGWDDLHA